jgi:hypothetical protein
MKQLSCSLITYSLCAALAFPPTLAKAQVPAPLLAAPRITLSFGMPYGGRLDRFHAPYSSRDPVANSLYALRNVAVEDLLNTRKALKILIGGRSRLRTAPGADGLDFSVPASVQRLYVTGAIHQARDLDPTLGWDTSEYGSSEGRSADSTESENEFGSSIHWLGTSSVRYVPAIRQRLAAGLVHASALLMKYDQQIRFIETDWWRNPTISRLFAQASGIATREDTSRLSSAVAGVDTGPLGSVVAERKAQYMRAHGMDRELAVLRNQREYLLNRFHLLQMELDGRSLYELIYDSLERHGFPSSETVQDPETLALPEGNSPFPVPREFDDAIDSQLNYLASTEGRSDTSAIAREINPYITRALVQALRRNTQRLEELCSEINYVGSMGSPLLELAQFEELWAAAREKYGYMAGPIDFHTGEQMLRSYLAAQGRAARVRTYAAWAGAVGLSVAVLISTGGVASALASVGVSVESLAGGALFGITASQWVWGSALLTTGMTYSNYVQASRTADSLNGMFYGGTRYGSAAATRDATLMAAERYHFFILSLVLSGVDLFRIRELSRLVPLYDRASQTFVAITRPHMDALSRAVQAAGARIRAFVPAGMAMLSYIRGVMEAATASPALIGFEQALPIIAAQLRLTPQAARARMLAVPHLGPILTNWGTRVFAPSNVWTKVARDLTVTGMMNIYGQIQARGDRFTDELGNVALNFATSMTTTAVLSFFANSINIRGQPTAEVAERLHQAARTNFWVGIGVNAAAGTVSEVLDEFENPDRRTYSQRRDAVLARSIYGGVFMSLSGGPRAALSRRLEEAIAARFSQPVTQMIMLPISAANNGFGSWHFVKLAQIVGAEAPLTGRAPTERVEDLGNAYVRFEDPAGAEAYMFDFLAGGE